MAVNNCSSVEISIFLMIGTYSKCQFPFCSIVIFFKRACSNRLTQELRLQVLTFIGEVRIYSKEEMVSLP